jgi:hypothetical protein
MSALRILAVMALSFHAAPAWVAEPAPRFPTSKITVEQWKEYLSEIAKMPGIERRESARQITLTNAKTMTIYAFTQEANPAHPGVVVRVLVVGPAGADVRRIGYFAGDQAAFTKWWTEFDALDAQIRRDMAR